VLGNVEAIVFRELRHPESTPAGNDGDFLDRIGAGEEVPHEGMPALVHGDALLVLLAESEGTARAQDDLVVCGLEVTLRDLVAPISRGAEGGFVDYGGKVRAREPGRLRARPSRSTSGPIATLLA